jgi:hypothetical protein
MQFKQWIIKEEAADREKQLDKATLTTVKPTVRAGELSRYGYLKKQKK